MENNQASLNPNSLNQARFRYLEPSAIEDPFSFVNAFCEQEAELYYLKRDVLDLVKTAYSYREEFFAGTSRSYAYSQIQLVKTVEILYVLQCTTLDLNPGNVRRYKNKYSCLSREEMKEPRVFLNDFFAFHSLDEWHELIDELLIHAYKEWDEGLFDNIPEPFKVMAYFEKLTEAIFLVHEIQRLKESYPKASGEVAEPG